MTCWVGRALIRFSTIPGHGSTWWRRCAGASRPPSTRASNCWGSHYHLDLDFGPGEGLVLYPHFYPYVVPGWFDKSLRWRRGSAINFRRALIIAPSPELIARLPGGKIPDRDDFYRLPDDERIRAWRQVLSESRRLGDELGNLLATGKIVEHLRPI